MILAKWHCLSCKHYVGWNRCVAFPEGIPQDITYQKSKHTKSRDGDRGLVYEPIEEGVKSVRVKLTKGRK